MLNKKHYYGMLIGGIIIFIGIFGITYFYIQQNAKNNINPQFHANSEENVDALKTVDSPQIQPTKIEPPKIEPFTEMVIRVIGENNRLISTKTIESNSFLGDKREDVQKKFKEYSIKSFTPEKVVLEKKVYQDVPITQYKLGCQNDVVGIVVLEENKKHFISLGILIDELSKQTSLLFQNEAIEITKRQKELLEKDSYYIEQILQNYSE